MEILVPMILFWRVEILECIGKRVCVFLMQYFRMFFFYRVVVLYTNKCGGFVKSMMSWETNILQFYTCSHRRETCNGC